MRRSFSWTFLLLIFWTLFLQIGAFKKEKRCLDDLRMGNSPKTVSKHRTSNSTWKDIKECTILDGDFIMAFISGNYTNKDFIVFPNLHEITGKLIVSNVHGLTNLGYVFPNLRIIGGQSSVLNNALIIIQNNDLRYIGLNNLKLIQNGGVRIAENPKLCFSQSINWNDILIGKIGNVKIYQNGYDSIFSENVAESCQDFYGCKVEDPKKCQKMDGILSCWNSTSCQSYCKYHELGKGPGCSLNGEKCHSSCLGGCELPNDPTSCYACQKYSFNGECVEKCPSNTFAYLDNRCFTPEECHNLKPIASLLKKNTTFWKAFHGKCHYNCPDGFQEDPKNPRNCIICENYCPRKCLGGKIETIKAALYYEKCNIIEGNLNINFENGEKLSDQKLTKAFENIREITGALLIQFSATFTSLHMFKNLEIIHGNKLINKRYALSVMDLENLQQLFPQNITIKNGFVHFENNPKLCYNKIMEFIKNINLKQNITDNDISKYSNGEKIICDFYQLNFNDVYFYGNRFLNLNWAKFNTTNLNDTVVLGYTIYYKKVDKIDIDIGYYGDDNENGGNNWESKFIPENPGPSSDERRILIKDFEPNTIYAYYIQAKVVSHPNAKHAISKIEFIKSPFTTPEMPLITKAEVVGPSKIVLEWDPPINKNGKITHYILMWNSKSIDNIDHDFCGIKLNPDSSPPSLLTSLSNDSIKNIQKTAAKNCHKSEINEKVTSENDKFESDTDLEDTVLDIIYPTPHSRKKVEESESDTNLDDTVSLEVFEINNGVKPIEYYHFDQYIIPEEKSQKPEANVEIIYPEIYNENITFGIANISSTRVILTGLNHFTEYSIQIRACQDITVPENSCSKQAAFRIVQTQPIPENDIIDLNSIKVFPYIVNGTEQGDSRVISLKIPDDPNGVILGFRYKIWRENEAPFERCISKTDYEKNNGILALGLKNGIYSFKVTTISSAGISAAAVTVRKDLFEINIFEGCTWIKMLYLFSLFIIIFVGASFYVIYHFYHQYIDKKAKKYTQKIIAANGHEIPLL